MYTIKGNKLIIHNTWQMTIPNECHVNCIPQGTVRHIQIMNGSQSLIDMYIADKKANQPLTQILSLEVLKSIKEECRPLSVSTQPVRTFPKAAKRKESNLVNAYNAVHYRING